MRFEYFFDSFGNVFIKHEDQVYELNIDDDNNPVLDVVKKNEYTNEFIDTQFDTIQINTEKQTTPNNNEHYEEDIKNKYYAEDNDYINIKNANEETEQDINEYYDDYNDADEEAKISFGLVDDYKPIINNDYSFEIISLYDVFVYENGLIKMRTSPIHDTCIYRLCIYDNVKMTFRAISESKSYDYSVGIDRYNKLYIVRDVTK